MENIYILGHKNPDTDSICSSLVKEILNKKMGVENSKAVRLGEVNKETQYVLENLNIQAPELITGIEDGQQVELVDHNEFTQSVDNIENAKILSVTDHHRIANFKTAEPLYYTAKPYGCTSTILFEQFKENGVEIGKEEAMLMLSAIVSDTLLLKSPTTTQKDKKALEELANIAGVDVESYGLEMLKAGTNLDDYSEKQLLNMDKKVFDKDGVKFAIAQVNTVDVDTLLQREEMLRKVINEEIENDGLDAFVFVMTNILDSDSLALILRNRQDLLSKTHELENDKALLKGMVSRKKQILPLVEGNV